MRATATVTLTDPERFPAQCQVPAGWVVPATAQAGWSAATDRSYEQNCSLKSAPIADGQAAEVSLTAVFTAGTISFRRKVSSEANCDFFRFSIDGVEQASARTSGDVDWTLLGFPITAGTHTITFRYEKDGYCCVGGSDAVWIDAVTLPLAPPPAPPPPRPRGRFEADLACAPRASKARGAVDVSVVFSNSTDAVRTVTRAGVAVHAGEARLLGPRAVPLSVAVPPARPASRRAMGVR